MKTFSFFLISFIFVTTLTFGQSNDEQEIRRLEKLWTELLDKGDTISLLKIWSKNYVVNNPNGEIVTPEKIVAFMKSGNKFPKVALNHATAHRRGRWCSILKANHLILT